MKSWLRYTKDWIYVLGGVLIYKITGKNHEFSYQALIRLYCRTRGSSSKVLTDFLKILHPAKLQHPVEGVLGTYSGDRLAAIADILKRDGFYVFENKLSENVLQDLLKISQSTKAILRKSDSDPVNGATRRDIYKRGAPEAVRYDYASEDLMRSEVVQKLVSDPSILAVARAYLGVEPVLDIVTMWWHTDFSKTPDSNAAQLFHFDMDRIKWLKFFFYVTDVTSETGPHCFIRGTHRAENIPEELLNRGYVRISDGDMKSFFKAEDFIEFEGRRGTVIAEDTSGLHKGKHVHKGDRLVFQLEFAVSMFGSPGSEKFVIRDVRVPELSQMMANYPRIYENFEVQSNG